MNFSEWLRFFLLNDDSSDLLGKYGEDLTARKLKWTKLFGYKGLMLRNVYIPAEIGETTEIDLIYITPKGLFIIESKNISGWIFGTESDRYWTQCLPDKSRIRFFNPIWQNRGHIKWLRAFLHDEKLPCFSLIVFSERCSLKKLNYHDENCVIIHRDELISTMRSMWKKLPDMFDEAGTQNIFDKLQNADEAMKQAHIDRIQEQYHGMKCPSCGAALVLRTTKKGNNAGKQFYGCSAFPKCRYVRDAEAAEAQTAVPTIEPKLESTAQPIPEFPKSPVPEPVTETGPDRKCPRCGAALVLRTAKKGDNAGKQFYGCSAFPKCRYIQNMEESECNSK